MKDLTSQQKRQALRAINLIKEKICSKLKGRTVAGRRPHRGPYSKDERAFHNVSTDALMISVLIYVWEKRDVATADVNGEYLHAKMDDFTTLKL